MTRFGQAKDVLQSGKTSKAVHFSDDVQIRYIEQRPHNDQRTARFIAKQAIQIRLARPGGLCKGEGSVYGKQKQGSNPFKEEANQGTKSLALINHSARLIFTRPFAT